MCRRRAWGGAWGGAWGCDLSAAELAEVAVLDFGDSGLVDLSVDRDARQRSEKVRVQVGVRDVTCTREKAIDIALVRKVWSGLLEDDEVKRKAMAEMSR